MSVIGSIDRKLRSLEYDPKIDIFRERAKMRKAKSKGIERFAFEFFGTDLIGSLAFALDRVDRTVTDKFPNDKVSTVTRVRNVRGIPACTRSGYRLQVNRSHSHFTPYDPFWGAFHASPDNEIVVDGRGSIPLEGQAPLLGYIKDTSFKTRPHGVNQGELEFFIPKLLSLPVGYDREQAHHKIVTNLPGSYYEDTTTWEHVRYGFHGPSLRMPVDGYHDFVSSYIASGNSLLSERALGMVLDTLPSKRKYTLARNLVELKDIPRLLKDTLRLYVDLSKRLPGVSFRLLPGTRPRGQALGLSGSYLSYKFGWAQLVKDIIGLLETPETIAKELSFFAERQGRPTTLRKAVKFSRKLAFHPTFETEVFNLFDEPTVSTTQVTDTVDSGVLKLALNVNVKFPRVDIPSIQDLSLVLHKMGAELTPADVYDLVPWTWLTEWFIGASEYLHMLEEIHYDKSLINYGLISFISKGRSVCLYDSKVTVNDIDVTTVPPTSVDVPVVFSAQRSAEFSFRSHIRKDLTSIVSSLKTTTGKGLSPYQLSILTALGAQRTRPSSGR